MQRRLVSTIAMGCWKWILHVVRSKEELIVKSALLWTPDERINLQILNPCPLGIRSSLYYTITVTIESRRHYIFILIIKAIVVIPSSLISVVALVIQATKQR